MTTKRAKPTTGEAYPPLPDAELIERLTECLRRGGFKHAVHGAVATYSISGPLLKSAISRLSERRGNWQGIISCPTDDSEWSMLLPDGDIVVGRWSISQNRWQKRSIIEKTAVWTNLPEGVYPTHYARRQPLPEAPK